AELVEMGARDRLPGGAGGDEAARYQAFRRQLAIPPSPPVNDGRPEIAVLVTAAHAGPAEVRATLGSLLDQANPGWTAVVHGPATLRDHPVASLAAIDCRIAFVDADATLPDASASPLLLLVAAGTVLDRHALGWFAFAAARTGSVAIYCDHDAHIDDWRHGRTFEAPVFQPTFDPDWFDQPSDRPAAMLVDQRRIAMTQADADPCALLHAAAAVGPVAHLPLLLASWKRTASPGNAARPSMISASLALAPDRTDPTRPAERIQVVIQTRDEAAMLRVAVGSLRARAAVPDALDIVIVDNRSAQPRTHALLRGYRRRGTGTVLPFDEPFNWARANNLAVEGGTAPLLLFLNNDTQMLSDGWDDTLRAMLAEPDIGAVGAMLLYPDRSVQHAGMIFGMGTGGPVHEGIGHDERDAGPAGRWRRRRSAVAVTGAFMGMRRDVFEAAGGFEALNFAIAFNDVDLCLRVRAAGRRIAMTPRIVAIHHESKTRGLNHTPERVAWDMEELRLLHDRWGEALFHDPAYNPHWARIGQPFDGYRTPPLIEVVDHLDRSARARPWMPVPARSGLGW
uniref:glycosyltransferase n=1 Tax=Sphingomonas bacterium TaxID=1895847 RepID=UPI0015753C86